MRKKRPLPCVWQGTSRNAGVQQDLCQLRRLKIGKTKVDPPGGAVNFCTYDKNSTQDQDNEAVNQPVKVHEPNVIDQRYDDHGRKGNDQANNLPGLIVRLCTSDYKHTQNGQCQNQNDKVHFIIF